MISSNTKNYKLVLSAMFLALALVLPFLTGQIPQIGNALCLIHFPVFLCGFFCGPWYALAVGFTAPLLRSLIFGMPPMIPKGAAMAFELATYGLVSGILYQTLPKKKSSIYISLITAMLAGRVMWGAVRTLFYGLGKSEFGWSAFLTGGFLTAIPGIIAQIIVIPVIVMALNKNSGSDPEYSEEQNGRKI